MGGSTKRLDLLDRAVCHFGLTSPASLRGSPRGPKRGQIRLVAVPVGLDHQPGDEALTDATLDEVGAWLDGKAGCPWPR